MNRRAVQVALVHRQVEGRFYTRAELARAVGCSRGTVTRFVAGQRTSLATTVKVLTALGLRFDEVFTRCEEIEEPT